MGTPLKVSVFTQVRRTYPAPTGVGKFINSMVPALARTPGFDVSLLVSRTDVDQQGAIDSRSPLRGLPLQTYPLHERVMERMWKLTGFPKADRWVGEADWLWLSAEAYVPVRGRKVLLTSYDMNQAEPTMPWENTADRSRRVARYRYWFTPSLTLARHVITISEYSKKRLCELFDVAPAKVTNVGCGVEMPYFDIADVDLAALPRPCDRPYLLVIGGLNTRKGGRHILEVAAALSRRKSELHILIAGPNEEPLVQAANSMDNVHLLGFVPNADLPAMLRQATALLFLSLYEGFGIPAAEAMAVGTPPIVANVTSLPEIVGDVGFAVDLREPEEIAAIAERLLHDAELRDEHSRRGRDRASQFTWAACVERLGAVLKAH